MDDHDLMLLRAFRADDASVPNGLATRIEGELWEAIRREEQAAQRARRRLGRRRTGPLLRPAITFAAVACLLLVVMVSSGTGGMQGLSSSTSSAPVEAAASPIAAAASSLFGAVTTSTRTNHLGVTSGPLLVAGPQHDVATGALDAQTIRFVDAAPRDAESLTTSIHSSLAVSGVADPAGHAAFLTAMRWVVATDVPVDLRAAMFRTLAQVRGMETATTGIDMLGRSGVVIGHLDATTGIREQFLLDTDSARLFEHRAYTTLELDPACPPGTLIAHDLYAGDGHPIVADDAPWAAWPSVYPACSPAL